MTCLLHRRRMQSVHEQEVAQVCAKRARTQRLAMLLQKQGRGRFLVKKVWPVFRNVHFDARDEIRGKQYVENSISIGTNPLTSEHLDADQRARCTRRERSIGVSHSLIGIAGLSGESCR
jgi:hypothetical protein